MFCLAAVLRATVRNSANLIFTFVLPYGIKHHMKAKLIYHEKFIYADGAVREMVLWQLPKKSLDGPYGLKYRLYYGLADGTCIVRYDNESGRGDHRHIKGKEEPYQFKDVETLAADFLNEIEKSRTG
jgi:hypothetical protein